MGSWDILAVENVQTIFDELQDVRQVPAPYMWAQRIPLVPSLDEEIMGRYTGRVLAADIIADDQKAVVRAPQPIRTQQAKIPNLKHGELITQAMLNVLARIEAGNASRRDNSIFEDYLTNRMAHLRDGVWARIEVLLVGMLIDEFTYER